MFYHASSDMTVNFIYNWKVENLAILNKILLNLARLKWRFYSLTCLATLACLATLHTVANSSGSTLN